MFFTMKALKIIRSIVCMILFVLFCLAVQDAFKKWTNPQKGTILETTNKGIHLPSFTICPFTHPNQDKHNSMSDILELPSIKDDLTLLTAG